MQQHNRKLNRYSGFDYSLPGYYFVTICTKNHHSWFGKIINNDVKLNKLGIIIKQQWLWLQHQYYYVFHDQWIIMPNHIHGIIIIDHDVGNGRDRSLPQKSLSDLIGAFKTTSSKLIHHLGYQSFYWQKSFYDRIIRNDKELNTIREYIQNNNLNWENDEYLL